MINLLKIFPPKWEQAKGYLRLDLEAIESALNTRWASLFGNNDRLVFSHLIAATQPSVLLGRRSTVAGDFEEISLGTGLRISSTTLSVDLTGLQGSIPIPDEPYHDDPWPTATTTPLQAFTQGSVIFAGPSGVLAQDNANLFWDDTTNHLGIGTASPTDAHLTIKPGTLLTGVNASYVEATLATAAIDTAEYGGYSFITSATSTTAGARQFGFVSDLVAGYTGTASTTALRGNNVVAGTGALPWDIANGATNFQGANIGIQGRAVATTTGTEIGVHGNASGGNVNFGMFGAAVTTKASAKNIGVGGYALNAGAGGRRFGGVFALADTVSVGITATGVSAALLADNGANADDIFRAQDNGTAVFTIADGGAVGIADGASALPGIAFLSDTSLGIYKTGVTAYFQASNSTKAGWDSAGFYADTLRLDVNNGDVYLTREAGGVLQMGLDRAAPIAQMIKGSDARAGTDTDTAGGTMTVAASRGTGTGGGGQLLFQTAPPGSTGTAANTLVTVGAFSNGGVLGIGTTAFPTTGTAAIVFGDGTVPATMGSSTAGLYADDVSGTVRMFGIDEAGVTGALAMASGALTSGRVALITTNGLLTDDADLTFATDTLTATKISTTQVKSTGSANNSATVNKILYGVTTDAATAVELTTDGAAGSGATNRIAVPVDSALSVVVNICVKQSGSANAKQMLRQFLLSNNGGTTAIQGSVTTLGTDVGSAGLTTVTCTITANDTDDCIKIEVNGVLATNLRYTAYVVSTETVYA